MKHLDALPPRHPLNGTLELTLRCNLRCKMCMFRHSDSQNPQLLQGELTADQWEDMARQLYDAGTLNLLITGGEPLLRQDFCEIYERIYAMGFMVTLYTNGTLVTDRVMDTLRRCPPHRIGVTVYGSSNATYETLCGCSDGFDRAISGIRALATLPSALEFRMTVVQDNLQEADAVAAWVKEEFDLPVTYAATVFRSVRGGCMPVDACRLTPEQNLHFLLDRTAERFRAALPPEQRGKLRLSLTDPQPDRQPQKLRYTLLGCSGGMDSYTITWDGKLLGCQMLENFQTDAFRSGFEKAWAHWPYTVRLPKINDECAACPHMALCQVCPGVRMAECGNLQAKPDYICRLTKHLASRKGENLL